MNNDLRTRGPRMVKLHVRITSAISLLTAGVDVEHTGLTLDDLDT